MRAYCSGSVLTLTVYTEVVLWGRKVLLIETTSGEKSHQFVVCACGRMQHSPPPPRDNTWSAAISTPVRWLDKHSWCSCDGECLGHRVTQRGTVYTLQKRHTPAYVHGHIQAAKDICTCQCTHTHTHRESENKHLRRVCNN